MTVESDTLVEAARRFGEVIAAERASTVAALEAERAATIKIIAALRKENERHARASGGKFVVGLLLGAAIGAAVVSMAVSEPGEETRVNFKLKADDLRSTLTKRVQVAIEAGKRAAAAAEQELWAQYRQRVAPST
ncbi:hypothetical protein [Candidatus Oscillochloris fontis]|uniref:hypothetical protein n=1 Tax=Candidatus Oscillochloris fontis TaxID=2496868 RepID=UPI00101B8789|nr:hypothetical protein [Candidatus Oscillochloris fontis]